MFFNQPGPSNAIAQRVAELLFIALEGYALSIEVFLHKRIGGRYVGMQIVPAAAVMACAAIWWAQHGEDPRPLIWFLVTFIGLAVFARAAAYSRAMRGDQTHSRYTGTPWLIKPTARLSEVTIKKFIEPALVGTAAWYFWELNPPLASHLLISAACLAGTVIRADHHMRMRTADMNDAVNEQQQVAEQFRNMHGGNF